MGDVVEFPTSARPKRQKKPRQKSQYELYPMPFFDRASLCTWKVQPTGNYSNDCVTGRVYALEFLRSCDGSAGWSTLLAQIASDMVRDGPYGTYPNGEPKMSGIVIGFMCTIGRALVQTRSLCESRSVGELLERGQCWSEFVDRAARLDER
jgi:hypothetical protein